MPRVLIIDQRQAFVDLARRELDASDAVELCLAKETLKSSSREGCIDEPSFSDLCQRNAIDTLIFSPRCVGRFSTALDLRHARQVFEHGRAAEIQHVVLLSSAAVYCPHHGNPGMISETRPTSAARSNRVTQQWRLLELAAEECLAGAEESKLTILRPCPTLVPKARDYFNRMFRGHVVMRFAGHDPSIQLLCAEDLARAVVCAVENSDGGVFNVAPNSVVPLRKALRQARVFGVPTPRVIQRPIRSLLRYVGTAPSDQAEFIRYSFTVDNGKIRGAWGFEPQRTSMRALSEYTANYQARNGSDHSSPSEAFDAFGLDEEYIQRHGNWMLRFLERVYWRIDVSGIENIPAEGPAVLVGVHRGFMPFDGVMFIHLLNRYVGRVPRFLMHPALVKFPFLAEFLTKLGGVIACEENAEHVLNRGGLLGVFPEGIRGAFRKFRDSYRLPRMGRSDYVAFALRHGAPIIPFVYLGTAEIFPILAGFKWSWWKRNTEWPFFPITPTFPWLPIPLPTKWHLRILEPIAVDRLSSRDKADEPRVVEEIAEQVRGLILRNLLEMRSHRKSVFWGSLGNERQDSPKY